MGKGKQLPVQEKSDLNDDLYTVWIFWNEFHYGREKHLDFIKISTELTVTIQKTSDPEALQVGFPISCSLVGLSGESVSCTSTV